MRRRIKRPAVRAWVASFICGRMIARRRWGGRPGIDYRLTQRRVRITS